MAVVSAKPINMGTHFRRNLVMEIEVYTPRSFTFRVWLAMRIIGLAARIFPFRVEVKYTNGEVGHDHGLPAA